jgi:UDP-N-acetylmuramyl tripeptide synthase
VTLADGRSIDLDLKLPGWPNEANAAMAAAAAVAVGVDAADALSAMGAVTEIAGRYGTVAVDGVDVRFLLAKNPAGWAEALDLVRPPPSPIVVGINARVADGRDPSWLWDVDFDRLRGRLVVATGERGRDLAVRLRYADVEHVFVDGYRPAVAAAAASGASAIDLAANYTAFQDARAALDGRPARRSA